MCIDQINKAVVMIRKKAGTQLKQGDMSSSFYSTNEKPTHFSSGILKDDRISGIKSNIATPHPFNTSNELKFAGQNKVNRRNITRKGGVVSIYKQRPKEEENKNFLMSDKAIKENHLLRSIRKLKQQDDKSAATRIGVGGKNENFSRMTTQLSNVRRYYGARSKDIRPTSKEQKMINQMYQKINHSLR